MIAERIVLHIGLEKTGTTAIQRALRNAPDRLAEGGAVFDTGFCEAGRPEAGNALGLVASCLDGRKRAGFLGEFAGRPIPHDFAAWSPEPADRQPVRIFSSEHLSSWITEPGEIARLHDFLSKLAPRITVIAYLRRQDRLAQSLLNEAMKAGATFTWRDLYAPIDRAAAKLDFVPVCARYAEIFGPKETVFGVFDRARLEGGDVVRDFLTRAGLDKIELPPRPDANVALTLEALYLMSLVNDLGAATGAGALVPPARAALQRHGRGRLTYLTSQRARMLLESHGAANRRLAALTGRPLFDEDLSGYPDTQPRLDPERLSRLAALPEVRAVLGPLLGGPDSSAPRGTDA